MEGGKKLGRNALNHTDQTLELEQRKYTVQRIEEERAKKQQALDSEYDRRARRLQCKMRLVDCGVLYSFSEIQEEARALYERYQNATKQLESQGFPLNFVLFGCTAFARFRAKPCTCLSGTAPCRIRYALIAA